ncbi:glycerate kinase [Acinetobacter lwoffii]|uniref:Glycerate kinase n=1 Tax=Acinetobacter lwoffii TaxID=28090 RepID=A0AAW8LIC5_ACILW|nr:glycerate kinase [Acinetobacter lwoffii]MDR6629416.1 glycerate kinase [Acinetobacter lwoffii]
MPLTFVLAPDSFKESMSAAQASQAMQRGIQNVIPDAHTIHVPMADGGEGTVDALISSLKGQSIACDVTGPLSEQRIQTYWGMVDAGQTAVVEMAKANGIHLLAAEKRNPMLTTTYGTGEMIKRALDLGVKKIIMGSGGSITNDGGAGMAQALGVQFLNHAGELIQVCGGNLDQVKSMDLSGLDPRLVDTEIIIASDVNNPLCGPNGASIIFGPQKGATPEMSKQLDQNLGHFADVVAGQIGCDYRHVAGAGAAGGLGFGLMAFTAASIRSGVELMIEQVQLSEKIAQADYVLTGEGKIDSQTSLGKTPFGVAQLARKFNKPVIAFAGLVGEGIEDLFESGFSQIVGINPPDCPLEEALKNAEMNLEKAVAEIVKNLLTE